MPNHVKWKDVKARMQADRESTRPSWDDWGLGLAQAVSARADCTRRKVGAVIVDKDHRVVSTGYNGSPPGGPSCLAGGCPRGQHFKDRRYCYVHGSDTCSCAVWQCACRNDWPCDQAVQPGSSYDTGLGSCIALHAEQNAIIWASPERLRDSTIYITCAPCDGCARLIAGVGIIKVVFPNEVKS